MRKAAGVAIAEHAGTPKKFRFRIAPIEGTVDTLGRPGRHSADLITAGNGTEITTP